MTNTRERPAGPPRTAEDVPGADEDVWRSPRREWMRRGWVRYEVNEERATARRAA